jgi:hypothetical protein
MFKKIWLGLLAVGLILSGCASLGGDQPEKVVAARAEARWNAMIAHDLDKGYEFLSPGSKAANPIALYKAKIRLIDWKSAKTILTQCNSEKCDVRLELTFTEHRMRGSATTVIYETWIKDNGDWWYVFSG